ncbi:MAG: hypothetical protein ACK4ON_01080 [Bacteroidia bacterium]
MNFGKKEIMGTTTYTNTTKENTREMSWYEKVVEKAKFSYFGLIAMTITVGSILGGVAAMFIFQNDAPTWQLGLAMSASMANNVAAIGQAPAKWIVNLFIVCTVLNLLLIAINL